MSLLLIAMETDSKYIKAETGVIVFVRKETGVLKTKP